MHTNDLSTTSFHANAHGNDGEDVPLPIPTLTIVYHPDLRRIGERLPLSELLSGHRVAIARHKPAFTKDGGTVTAPLMDEYLSRRAILLEPSEGGAVVLHAAQSRTTVSRNQHQIEGSCRFEREALSQGVVLTLAGRVVLLLHLWVPNLEPAGRDLGLVGRSNGMNRVRGEIKRVADLSMPVLITGESGTGKELVARAIHETGPRRNHAFVCVNMGAIPASLAASELFGAVKGAYTGSAQSRLGFFRSANGGTLFLDEIGEAPAEVQVMLLRVLETGKVLPVGSQHPVAVDVRVIAATDAKLEKMATGGTFKCPLLHRLAGYEIRLPTLRDRRDDFGHLFFHFLREELGKVGELNRLTLRESRDSPWLPADIAAGLCACPWPGNIRQLRNAVRQIAVSNRGTARFHKDPKLSELLASNQASAEGGQANTLPRHETAAPLRKPAHLSEEELIAALEAEHWDLLATSKRLRISRPSLYRLIKQSDQIVTAGDLGSQEISQAYQQSHGDVAAAAAQLRVSKTALRRRIKELKLDCHER